MFGRRSGPPYSCRSLTHAHIHLLLRCAVKDDEKQLWTVPLLYATGETAKEKPAQLLFDTETVSVTIPCKVCMV